MSRIVRIERNTRRVFDDRDSDSDLDALNDTSSEEDEKQLLAFDEKQQLRKVALTKRFNFAYLSESKAMVKYVELVFDFYICYLLFRSLDLGNHYIKSFLFFTLLMASISFTLFSLHFFRRVDKYPETNWLKVELFVNTFIAIVFGISTPLFMVLEEKIEGEDTKVAVFYGFLTLSHIYDASLNFVTDPGFNLMEEIDNELKEYQKKVDEVVARIQKKYFHKNSYFFPL